MRDSSHASTRENIVKNGIDEHPPTIEAGPDADGKGAKSSAGKQKRAIDILQATKAFSDMVGVMMRSTPQRHLFLADLEWFLLPALGLRQYKIYSDGKQVQAFAVWASLSEDVEKRLIGSGGRLRPSDWRSGDRLWLMEVVGPNVNSQQVFGQLIGDLVKGPFAGKKFKMMGTDPKTGKRRVLEFGPKVSKGAIEEAAETKAVEAAGK